MKNKLRAPGLIHLIATLSLVLMLCMTIYRVYFFYHFKPPTMPLSGSALWLGVRFDARYVFILALAMFLIGSVPLFNPLRTTTAKKTWVIALTTLFSLILLIYISDFYHYDYLKQRLNSTVMNYAEDASISLNMVWETYPVLRISIALVLFVFLMYKLLSKLFDQYQKKTKTYSKRKSIFTIVLFVLFCAIAIFGRLGQYPLRWSDAFALNHDFKANAALNPFQSFASSLKFKDKGYNIADVKAAFPIMSKELGMPLSDSATLNFARHYNFSDSSGHQPNIVIVLCESFSAPKASMFGNLLNPTPFFDSLSKQGLFFNSCYTPAHGTARGVWALVTGIPDVEHPGTASRNPLAVDQHCIINDFSGYDKYYFLGGSTTWANIRGLLTNNIDSLKIYEQENFDAKRVDVWGISDKNLFLAANDVFKKQSRSFISIIQTADNHKPYTIPEEDLGPFQKVNMSEDSLKKYGFESVGQYNAFRYMDYCFKVFMNTAAQEKYFDNTVFVFVGDHGIKADAGSKFSKFYSQTLVAEHVPLLFYGKKYLQPQTVSWPVSQMDILPTVANIARQSFTNTTLGRNLLDTAVLQSNYTFIADPILMTKGIATNEYYYMQYLDGGRKTFNAIANDNAVAASPKTDSIKKRSEILASAWYTTAQYLLLNNKKIKRKE